MSKNKKAEHQTEPSVHEAVAPAWSEWVGQGGLDGPLRAFAAILDGAAASRSSLSALLRVRSTTVSGWVAAMVRARLVTELPSQPGTRGRPLGQLLVNPQRLAVTVLTVRSQALHAVTLNLLGQVLWHESAVLPPDGGNAAMNSLLRGLQQRAAQRLPAGTVLAGTAYSLSGLVQAADARWVFVSRWPGIRNLALNDSVFPAGTTMHVVRNMDAQLRARGLRRGAAGQGERTLMLHWGYGIGAAFSAAGAGSGARIGDTAGFGEVGHWRLSGEAEPCRCGHQGCLETVAALWSIGPALLGRDFDDAMDETRAADLLRGMALTTHPVFARALREMVLAVGNLCRVFFPTHLVISGPFIENPGAWAAFTAAFSSEGLLMDLPLPRLEAQSAGYQLEQEGASMPLLLNGVMKLLAEAPASDAPAPKARRRVSRAAPPR